MKPKMKTLRMCTSSVLIIVFLFMNVNSAVAGHCGSTFLCDDTTGLFNCQLDCNTYSETYYQGPMTPAASTVSATTQYPINDSVSNCTRGASNVTSSVSYTIQVGGSMTDTATGALAATVGGALGGQAAAAVNLSGTLTVTKSWSWTDSTLTSKTWTANYNVAACQIEYARLALPQYQGGPFSMNGEQDWTANVRSVCYVEPWLGGAGSCDSTNANTSAVTNLLPNGN